MSAPPPDDEYSDDEAARRRDAVIRRMIATPPKPHKTPTTKAKGHQVPKRRVHKGRSRA